MAIQNSDYNLKNELLKIWNRRWWILGFSLIASIITLALSYLWPDEYKSTSEFIPPHLSSIKELTYVKDNHEGMRVGTDEDLEHLVAVLQSGDCIQHMINKFDLYTHYQITEGTEQERSKKMSVVYKEKIEVQASQFSTILITVYDVDPKIASDIANEYLAFADSFIETVAQRRSGLRRVEMSMDSLLRERERERDTMAYLRQKYGIYRLDNISPVLAGSIDKAKLNSPEFSKYYDRVITGEKNLLNIEDLYNKYRSEYKFRKEHIDVYASMMNIIERGKPARFKDRPKRLLLMVFVLATALIFSSLVVLLMDRNQNGTA